MRIVLVMVSNLGILALLLLAVPVSARAADKPAYVGFDAGVVIPGDIDATANGVPGTITSAVGGGFSAFLGYQFDRHGRFEVNLAYRIAPTETLHVGGASIPFQNDVNLLTPMLNLYLDVPIGDTPITPYVGGGVGGAFAWTTGRGGLAGFNASAQGAAYAAMAGFHYLLGPSYWMRIGYRFTGTENLFDPVPGSGEIDLRTHDLMVGMRVGF